MGQLIAATVVFIMTHTLPCRTPVRGWLVGRLGEKGFQLAYSLVSAVTLGWMILAFVQAPRQTLWDGEGLAWLPLVVMPLALYLVVAAYSGGNPTGLYQETALKRKTPARGVLRITRHPMLWGTILWASAHILASGQDTVLVFLGGFLVESLLGTVMIDRKRAALGAEWSAYRAVTSNVPFAAILSGRNHLDFRELGVLAPVIALGLYASLILLHPYLFGVPAF
ncbi:MAG: NnrU family protein [Deltaproteobacteria bacterium]|nr:NnrU family protein [Deltaproteobacteria bacterium]